METYSRSHTRSHSRTATTTSVSPATFSGNDFKKPPLFPANGGGGGFFATAYDDVFGGAPGCATLAPRPEEYSEIFGVFRTSSSSRASSSIPVLDLPAVTDIDSTASVFDYSEVFAGFHGVDFAVPYDELFQPFDAGDGCSSDEAWTPVGTESLSDDSDPFASSEKSQCFSHEDSYQPLDSKQFNVLYHKVNSGTSLCMPNMTHVEQLNAVHGYTCVVDGTTSSREMGTERGRSVKADDIVFSMDSSSIMLQKHKRKTMSEISLDAGFKSVDDDQTSGRACAGAATMSHVNSTYASVSDINLRMESSHWSPPSKAPPVGTERKRDINRSSTGLKASNGCVSEVTVNSRLPHCFDMEVNASSSAAASAAAMKDAMEKAQAKLKAAKVLMDRKKDVLQDTARLNLKTDVNRRDNVTIVPECASGDNRVQTASERGPAKMNNFGNDRHVTTTSQSLPINAVVEQPKIVTRNAAERKHGKKCSLPTDTVSAVEDGEWLEATMCNDFVTSDNARLVPPPPSNGGGYSAVCKLQGDDDQNSDSTAEACLPEGNRRKLKANKAVSRQEYYEKLIKVAQQVHESDICVPAETDQRLTGMPQGNHREHRAKLGCEREKNGGTIGPSHSAEKNSIEASWIEATKGMSKDALEMEEIMKKETEAYSQGWNDGKTYGPQQSRVKEFPETKEEEIRMRGSYGRVETEGRLQEIVASEENEKISSEIYEKQRKEGKRDVVKQKKENERREISGKNSKDLFEDGLGGEVLQTACGSLEKGKTKELKKEEVKRSQEALVDVVVGERLQRTGQVQESGKINDLLQRKENGNYFEVAADRQGSEHILEDSVMLESHSKCEDAPGRVIRRQRLDECHQLAAGDKRSGQGLKQDCNEEKFERVTEQGTIEKKSMQVGEMEEAVKIQEKAGYGENAKVVSRSHSEDEWDDEEQGSGNSPEIELLTENEFVESSGGPNLQEQSAEREPDLVTSKLIKPHTEADGFLYVSAQKKNAEDVAVTSDEESRLKAAESTEGLAGEKPTDSTAAQMGAVDNEHERMVHVQDSFDSNNNKSKSGVLSSTTGLKVKNENKKVAKSVADPKLVKDFNLEQGGKGRNFGEGHAPSDQEKIVKSASTEGNNDWNEYARKKETACIDAPESKEGMQKRSQLPNISQSTEWKGKIIDRNCSYEEKTKEKERNLEEERLRKLEEERERERERNLEEERLRKLEEERERERERNLEEERLRKLEEERERERERNLEEEQLRKLEEERERERERNLEEERLRKLEEEREREREREKDRMAVEIAIREARERAYADARDRAERLAFERATDESRQRAMAEARERLEKACAEARERSLADKASEARLRAERAAVERATAEARQRAIEKVMAERATFEARERMQRSVSEKFTSERDVFMRQSSMPSMHNDKPEATDCEPAQRCKARLERHRRTVERVAKALAEKNMRDLLAQREQAERSRLAETLDADIKRWSSGKEGNLRALLSTLQYILAPDSGWQPIPLTEVITAAAVKKAYRKATLCVHPDKLQQRGASVQQKYICEKVFDLLKEAWNRFNSEEK